MILLRLFWEFFKTGLFAVGGGMATLPFLRDIGIRTGWFTQQKLADMIAVSESMSALRPQEYPARWSRPWGSFARPSSSFC